MSQPMISLIDAGYRYKIRRGRFSFVHFEALAGVTMTVQEGETLGLIGRNGAGKSTLLKLLANIYVPSSGAIRHHRPGLCVALLTLQVGFSHELSGRDNAIMGAMLLGHTRAEAEESLDRIIDFSGLGDWINEPLKSYSSGMRARLGFAVAMEMSPDIMLVDEVFGVGDVTFRQKSTERMKSRISSGQTVVLVSHSLPVVQELCTRVVWLENGRILMQGDTKEIVAEYQKAALKK